MTTTTTNSTDASDARTAVTRAGLVGRGVYYTLLAVFALDLALHPGTDDQGAIEQVASAPFGRFILTGLVVVLGALVAWKVTQVISGDAVEGSEASDRAKYAAKALAYMAVAATALSVLVSNWSSGGSGQSSGSASSKEEATSTVLGWPGGQVVVIAFGFGIMGFGVYEIWKYGINAEFWHRFETGDLDQSAERAIELSGRAGYIGKGVITAVVGVFFVTAGFQHDPDDATGLSGALTEVADAWWGPALLVGVAIGLFLFAVFSAIEAKYRPA